MRTRGLSHGPVPRRINQAIKNELRAAGMKYEGNRDVNEAYTQWREFRRVPVPRLVNKIGISRYMELPTNDLGALSPAEVRIPLRQHISARPGRGEGRRSRQVRRRHW
ncbi:MAG: hypothetical protein ACLR7Z_02865 [Bilophila wadsworthia]